MLTLLTALPSLTLALASSETPLEKATEAFQNGEYSVVLELAKEGAMNETDAPRLTYLAGEAQLVLGAPADAETCFRDVLAARPKAIPAQVGLGRALTEQQKNEEALQVLTAALEAEPMDVGALTAHGLLLSRTGHIGEAKERLAQALKLEPKNALTVRSYVEVLLRADDIPAAAEVTEAFSQARPDHPLSPFLLAWTMERDGEDEAAIEQYQEALARDPGFIDAHKNLAILCHTLSNTYRDKVRVELAYAHYARYFELGGKDAALASMFKDLESFKEQILGS